MTPLARASLIFALGNALQRGSSFLLIPLYTRALEPAEYGNLVHGILLASLLQVVLLFGSDSVILRKHGEAHRNGPDLLSTLWGGALLLLVPGFLAGGLGWTGFGAFAMPDSSKTWFWSVPILAGGSATLQLYLVRLQAETRALEHSAIATIQLLGTTGILLLMVQSGVRQGDQLLAAQAIFVGFLALLLCCRLVWDIRPRPTLEEGLRSWRYAAGMIPHTGAGILLSQLDRFALANISGDRHLGIYNVALQFGSLLSFATQGFSQAFAPWFYQADLGSPRVKGLLRVLSVVIPWMCAIAAFLLPGALQLLKPILLGPGYGEALRIVPIVGIGFAFQVQYMLFVAVLFRDSPGRVALCSGAALATALLLDPLLVHRFGTTGAALAFVANFALLAVGAAILGRGVSGIRQPLWTCATVLLLHLAAVVIVSSIGLRDSDQAGILAIGGIGSSSILCLFALRHRKDWRSPT